MFIFKNPIKENRKKQDAIIRALAIAENRSWEEVYKDLCRAAFEICDNPQYFDTWKYYLIGRYPGNSKPIRKPGAKQECPLTTLLQTIPREPIFFSSSIIM